MAEVVPNCAGCSVVITNAVRFFACDHFWCRICADPLRFCPICYRVRRLYAVSTTLTFAQRLEAFIEFIQMPHTARPSRREE